MTPKWSLEIQEKDQQGGEEREKRSTVVGQEREGIYYYSYLSLQSPSNVKSSW